MRSIDVPAGSALGPVDDHVLAVSLDVFDTCLTRVLPSGDARFGYLGRRLAGRGWLHTSPPAFARVRENAEGRTFFNGIDVPASLETIYEHVRFSLHWEPERVAEAVEAELALETEVLRPILPVREFVEVQRAAGRRIVFTSDMYLPSSFIRARLEEHGFWQDGDAIFVSSEHQASKASGRLFRVVQNELETSPDRILHVGNDAHSDKKMAERSGWQARHFEPGNLNRLEKSLSGYAVMSEGLSDAYAGTSRLVRLGSDDERQALVDTTSSVIAPFIVDIAWWVLRSAHEAGVRRVYFVARDGQLMHWVASRIGARLGLGIDCRYLMGSRQAWCLPSLTKLDEAHLANVIPKGIDVSTTLASLLDRVHLSVEEFESLVPGHRLPSSRPLSEEERARVDAMIRSEPRLGNSILERARIARALALRYLKQEGMLEETELAFFDLGTGATLKFMLDEILSEAGRHIEHSYYWAVRPGARRPRGGYPLAYFGDWEGKFRGHYYADGTTSLLEAALAGDHGTVTSYAEEDGRVVPRFGPDLAPELFHWGLQTVRDTVLAFADTVPLSLEGTSLCGDVRPALGATIEMLWETPTQREAEAWGSFPMEDGWGEQVFALPLAHRLGAREVYRGFRVSNEYIRRHIWPAGSRKLSSARMRTLFDGSIKAGKAAKKLRHLLRSRY